jgi:hypothetical protein
VQSPRTPDRGLLHSLNPGRALTQWTAGEPGTPHGRGGLYPGRGPYGPKHRGPAQYYGDTQGVDVNLFAPSDVKAPWTCDGWRSQPARMASVVGPTSRSSAMGMVAMNDLISIDEVTPPGECYNGRIDHLHWLGGDQQRGDFRA